MKSKKVLMVALLMIIVLNSLTACGDSKKKLLGTWYLVGQDASISFYEDGKISENIGIYNDSYGISYEATDGEIQFIYYNSVAATAEYDISGNEMELKVKYADEDGTEDFLLEKRE